MRLDHQVYALFQQRFIKLVAYNTFSRTTSIHDYKKQANGIKWNNITKHNNFQCLSQNWEYYGILVYFFVNSKTTEFYLKYKLGSKSFTSFIAYEVLTTFTKAQQNSKLKVKNRNYLLFLQEVFSFLLLHHLHFAYTRHTIEHNNQ